VAGSVSNQRNVAVQLKGGHFQPQKFKVRIENPAVATVLTEYFAKLGNGYEVYNFGTLDFNPVSVLKSLTPSVFLFHVYHTPSNRDLLQLFIATTGTVQSSAVGYLREPVPTNYECSLIVNSKIFFKDVIEECLSGTESGLVVEGVAPVSDPNKDKPWSAKATAGSIPVPFPTQMVANGILPPVSGSSILIQYEDYLKVPNNKAVVNLNEMKFQNGEKTSGWDVKMSYDVLKPYTYQYGERTKSNGGFYNGGWSGVMYHDHSLRVTLKMSANLPLIVNGSGQNQMLAFAST
jgi:hypothetical protein